MTKYLSREDVAEAFGVSEKTIQRWTAQGWLKPARIGYRTVRYAEDDLEALFKKFRDEPKAATP